MAQLTGTANFPVDRSHVVSNAGDDWSAALTAFNAYGYLFFFQDGVIGDAGIAVTAMSYNSGTNKYSLTLAAPVPGSTNPIAARLNRDYGPNGAVFKNAGDSPLTDRGNDNRNAALLDSLLGRVASLVATGTREIWIGKWLSSSAVGEGSKGSPLNAPDQPTFDAIRTALGSGDRVINLTDDEFETHSLALPATSALIGRGPKMTSLKFATSTTLGGDNGVLYDPTTIGDRYIEGLTIDTNRGAFSGPRTDCAMHGIYLAGAVTMKNVNVLGVYGDNATGHEAWGILVVLAVDGKVVIEDVVVDGFIGNYINGITVVHTYGGTISKGATVKNPRVLNAWVSDPNHHGAGIGMDRGTVINPYVEHCQIGLYFEIASAVEIIAPKLYDIWQSGILVAAAQPCDGIKITGGEIEIRDDNSSPAACVSFASDASDTLKRATNGQIVGVTMRKKVTGLTPGPVPYGINCTPADYQFLLGLGHRAIGNTIDPALRNFMPPDSFRVGNTRSDTGATALGLHDTVVGEQRNTPNYLLNSLRIKGNRTGAGGYFVFSIALSSAYTPVAGDVLEISSLVTVDSTSGCMQIIFANGGGAVGLNILFDEEGFSTTAMDLRRLARGVYYEQRISLTPVIGTSLTSLVIGGGATNENAVNAAAGVSTYHYRRARIVGTAGVIRREIVTPFTLSGTPGAFAVGSSSDYSALIYSPAGGLPQADPHELGLRWVDPAAGYVEKVSQG